MQYQEDYTFHLDCLYCNPMPRILWCIAEVRLSTILLQCVLGKTKGCRKELSPEVIFIIM